MIADFYLLFTDYFLKMPLHKIKRTDNLTATLAGIFAVLIWSTTIAFSNKYKAYNFEKYLKSGSAIAFRNKRLI